MEEIEDKDGFVTLEQRIIGFTPTEMENLLGFRAGRMRDGARVYALLRLPQVNEFDFAGYTYLSGGKSTSEWKAERLGIPAARQKPHYDEDYVKRYTIKRWSLNPPNRLVKVIPKEKLENETYPHVFGIEQWIVKPLPAKLVRELGPNEVYRPLGKKWEHVGKMPRPSFWTEPERLKKPLS